jgi:hypothetical protein
MRRENTEKSLGRIGERTVDIVATIRTVSGKDCGMAGCMTE